MADEDEARERALEENRRRSQVMAEAQRHGPPAARCTTTDHSWAAIDEGAGRFLICERCAATAPCPEVEPGVRLVPVEP